MNNTIIKKWKESIIKFYSEKNSLILNIFFILLFIFLQKPLVEASRAIVYGNTKNIAYGIVIIILLILEVYAYAIKIKTLPNTESKTGGMSMMVWVLHLITGMILAIFAYGAISGVQITEATGDNVFFGLMVFIEVIRGLIILGILGIKKYVPDMNLSKRVSADIIISLFNFLALIITWYTMTSSVPALNLGGIGLTIFNTACALILFIVFYVPLNMFYFLDFYSKPRTFNETTTYYLSWIIIIILALSQLYK